MEPGRFINELKPVGLEELIPTAHVLANLIRSYKLTSSPDSLKNIQIWLDKCRQGLLPARYITNPIQEGGECTVQDIVDALDLAQSDPDQAIENILSRGYKFPQAI